MQAGLVVAISAAKPPHNAASANGNRRKRAAEIRRDCRGGIGAETFVGNSLTSSLWMAAERRVMTALGGHYQNTDRRYVIVRPA